MSKTPPKYPLRFFRWFCYPDYAEDIEGDLLERFEKNPSSWGFTLDVLKLFRPGIIKEFEGTKRLNYYGMFKHNLLITFRSFKRYKSSFLINLIGLSSGLACTLLIYLWVNDEVQTDKFHENDERLYSVMGNFHTTDGINTWNGMPIPLPKALEAEFPEIEKAVGSTNPSWRIAFNLTSNEKKLKAVGKYASKQYFDLFSYDLIQGSAENVLSGKNGIVISDQLAIRLFGKTKGAIGKSIEWNGTSEKGQSIVSGVYKNPPENSTDQFDFLLPFENYLATQQNNWYAPTSVAYVLLQKEADVEDVNKKISGFLNTKTKDSEIDLFLRPYSDGYLYGDYENGVLAGGRIQYVKLFSIIAVFILIIACINFMNLSTAKASRRIKELGVKKASGASRANLIIQYLSESVAMAYISLFVAIGIVILLLPLFNEITEKQIMLSFDKTLIISALSITLIAGLISGSYPALYLSGFNPAIVLKGTLKNSVGELWIRKGLVVFQFSISIILIVSVFVVYRQVEFVQNKHLGYDRENVIVFENNGRIAENFDTFISEMKNISGVKNASGMTNSMFFAPGGGLEWNGTESSSSFSRFMVYYDFIETLGLKMKQGESFSRTNSGETRILINESAAKLMALEEPVGTKVKFWNADARIIGVVQDFNFQSLHEDVGPMFFHLYPTEYLSSIVVKLKPGDPQTTIAQLQEFYSEFNPGYTLDYRFLDSDYQQLYESENKVGTLSKYFASITILISCLGLFGLAAFTAERRIKEIGIRKILGSSVFQIVKMLSGDFTKIVLVAIIIALPISYFITKNWLLDFAYSIQLKWWFFVGAALLSITISWITVGIQTVKAARANPVNCLKSE
ncbi:MAG: ABC transporter permease [Ekhidna sp.]